MTLEQIKQDSLRDEYINQIKAKIFEKDHRTTDVFSICDELLLYRERVVIPSTLQKRILKDFQLHVQPQYFNLRRKKQTFSLDSRRVKA